VQLYVLGDIHNRFVSQWRRKSLAPFDLDFFKKSYYKKEDPLVATAVKEAEEHLAKNLDLPHYTRLVEAFKQRKTSNAAPAKNVKAKRKV